MNKFYEICCENSYGDLSKKVNEMIEKGYVVAGGIFVHTIDGKDNYFQAVVKSTTKIPPKIIFWGIFYCLNFKLNHIPIFDHIFFTFSANQTFFTSLGIGTNT